MKPPPLDPLIKKFQEAGQGHVFKLFDKLSDPFKQEFLNRALLIDLHRMHHVIECVLSKTAEKECSPNLMPVHPFSLLSIKEKQQDYLQIAQKGEHALQAGRVGALVVAGGQGTRLGFHGPKGILPVTPVKMKSFFQIFAEKIKVAQDRYHSIIPWYIMTSKSNYNDTLTFFNQNDNFGLNEVFFFNQGLVPYIDFNGKFILDDRGLIAMAPDGHGGCFESLLQSGLLAKMEERGIDVISYFQVDNPLVKCIDPLFIGLHLSAESDMSSKVVKKLDPTERVGLFCKENNRLKVMEYSHAPQEMLTRRNPNGELSFNAGNIAVHLLNREFIKNMAQPDALPFHAVRKVTPFLNPQKHTVLSAESNSIKFEKLIFDALAEAKNPILMEVAREEEFSPVKNAQGNDSPESCKNDQLRQAARWLKAADVDVDCTKEGLPLFNIEISPLFADSQDAFVEKWKSLSQKPEITGDVYLEP